MKTQREKIILNYFDPHKSLDVVDMYNWLSPDITISEPDELPWGGQYHGLTGVGTYLTKVTLNIISEIKVEEVYTCGELVIAIGRSKGKVRKTGRPFDIRVTQLFTFTEDNKINRVEFLSDLPAFMELLETQPSPS
jgi:ketosteroid isomerase-like protein